MILFSFKIHAKSLLKLLSIKIDSKAYFYDYYR